MKTSCLIVHTYIDINMHVSDYHKIGNLDFAKQKASKSNLGLVGYMDGRTFHNYWY